MKAAYAAQVASGTLFDTPLTDISDVFGDVGATDRVHYAYVKGPDGALIELNTAAHHRFGHIHLFSADPVAAGEPRHLPHRVSAAAPRRPVEGPGRLRLDARTCRRSHRVQLR